jgi:hypothetical protein
MGKRGFFEKVRFLASHARNLTLILKHLLFTPQQLKTFLSEVRKKRRKWATILNIRMKTGSTLTW